MSETRTRRTRTISWEDPAPAFQTGKTMSGLQYLKAIQAGEVAQAPMAQLIGMWLEEVSEGKVVMAVEPAEYHYNPIGVVHGGLAATILDTAVGCTVLSTLPPGTTFTTLELKVNYVRPLFNRTGTIYAEGKIIHKGNRIATVEGHLTDTAGKLYAHATSTCMLIPVPS